MGRWTRGLIAAALVGAASAAGAPGQERRLTLESFAATIEVEAAGALDVREELRFRFEGSWNGVFRSIPVRYDLGGSTHRVRLEVVSVRDVSGAPLRHEVDREGAYAVVKVWVPDARDTQASVVLHYRVRDALRFFENHDELYWNVTGNEWDVEIESASARVVLPDGASGRRAAAYTGAYGERGGAASVTEIEEGFFFETTAPLAFREGLTVVVGWNPGVVHRPDALERLVAKGFHLFLLPLLSLGVMWKIWAARGRDPQRRAITPRYEPPDGLGPAEAGTLIDNRPDLRDLTASLVDLAVRGYLRIHEEAPEGLGKLFGRERYAFERLRPSDDALRPHERALLADLFEKGDHVSTKDLEHSFYARLPGLKGAILDQLKALGHYDHRPDKVLHFWSGLGAMATVGGAVLLAGAAANWGMHPTVGGTAGALTGLPVLLFGLLMPARTVRGTRALEETKGFQEFLDRVESDRFRRMIEGPEQFEAFLPYAMAFGVAEQWARAFEGIYDRAPEWYVSSRGGAFRPLNLVSSLDSMSTRTGQSMASAPRSSSGSGFSSGGGFSGGGFGGGGGGGF